jgi:hypothetical protein
MIAFESPRWLIQKGKFDAARITLRQIERINGSDTKERLKLLDNLIEQEKQVINWLNSMFFKAENAQINITQF